MEVRRGKIITIVQQEGNVSLNQLKAYFPDVSEMTLRRDLEALDQEKKIIRIHGGAKSVATVIGTENLYSIRSEKNIDSKQIIAQKALTLLKPHMSIFIDSGSTNTELAKLIPDEQYLIFTSGLTCAIELAHLTKPIVYVIGGRLNNNSLSVNGTQSIQQIADVNIDIAFLGASGFVENIGFTSNVMEDYELKRAVMRKAEEVVVLMDSEKAGLTHSYTYARPEDVDTIISDDKLDQELVRKFREKGINVL